jgi:A/G-specific adenine glycosylase
VEVDANGERRVRVRRRLLRWWRAEGRDFPWRHTRDPWAVLLAELMLQRTRADLVPRVYEEAMRRYPTAAAFADAPRDELAVLLRPLGFLRRNERLRLAADACRDGVPRTMAGLLAVPGVGRYAATATLCFAFGRRVAVIDPSVIRLLARLELGTSERARPREDPALWAAADALLPAHGAREWNYAVLDHAATVCRPAPRCPACPLLALCPTGTARAGGAPGGRRARHGVVVSRAP